MRPEDRLARRGGPIELLRIPAVLFGAAARLRGSLYTRRILRSYPVQTPVISVGNLSVGGTGKTPTIEWLCRELTGRGRRPGIVSRGYRAAEGAPNDEAMMLARLLPDVPHVQDRDRVAAARRMEAEHQVDVILLDDGFQHRRLRRDLDIVLLDAQRPFGLPPAGEDEPPVRALLPRGLMREPLSALRRADACVVTRADPERADQVAQLRSVIRSAAPEVPVAEARHMPSGLREVRPSERTVAIGDLRGRRVDLLSGIGNPKAFERTVAALGAIVQRHRALPDHHAFTAEDLQGLGWERPVVTTAKDAARLVGQHEVFSSATFPEGLFVLDVQLEMTANVEAITALLDDLFRDAGGTS